MVANQEKWKRLTEALCVTRLCWEDEDEDDDDDISDDD